DVLPYLLKKKFVSGAAEEFHDPYSFLPTLTDFDLYLFNAGDHHFIYEKLGAHAAEVNGVHGIQFAVWAPDARSVSVVGDFNNWDARRNAMRVLGGSGVWEIFLPDLSEGMLYKYQVKTKDGRVLDKSDPYAFEMEHRPRTASRVNFLSRYDWSDHEWMEKRKATKHLTRPMSIYEVHLGSWARVPEDGNRWLTYREMAKKLTAYVKERGFTHVELLPVLEHPFDGSWGYQVTGYYAPTSRFGSPQEFMYFVDQFHQHGIGVILDWVPAHFPNDPHALGEFDGTHLYEHSDRQMREHPDWGSYIFNYGRREVKNFLTANALFWIEKYHLDGLRMDAVASMLYRDYSRKEGEWVPNKFGGRENLEAIDFVRHVNAVLHKYHPDVLTIAEESTAWPSVTRPGYEGGLGFDLKWNMGWMHDILSYFEKDPIYRKYHHSNLTFALLYAFSEHYVLPLSHDEAVHGKGSLIRKMSGDIWQKFANLRLLYGLMYAFPGKKLLFMGGEFGQWREWNHDSSLDWHLLGQEQHRGLSHWIDDLNDVYKMSSALHEVDFSHSGFEWIDFRDDEQSVLSFLRKSSDGQSTMIIVCNFTPVQREAYRIGVPEPGEYLEVLNSDSSFYGGSNAGNRGHIPSEPVPFHGRAYSLSLTLPPLASLYLRKSHS
ncbi:MAG TPA: 1,4-alpha-glucan branching protein GlgB, partial [Bacteroidota bacterium]